MPEKLYQREASRPETIDEAVKRLHDMKSNDADFILLAIAPHPETGEKAIMGMGCSDPGAEAQFFVALGSKLGLPDDLLAFILQSFGAVCSCAKCEAAGHSVH